MGVLPNFINQAATELHWAGMRTYRKAALLTYFSLISCIPCGRICSVQSRPGRLPWLTLLGTMAKETRPLPSGTELPVGPTANAVRACMRPLRTGEVPSRNNAGTDGSRHHVAPPQAVRTPAPGPDPRTNALRCPRVGPETLNLTETLSDLM